MELNNMLKKALEKIMEVNNIRLDKIGLQMLYDELDDSEVTLGEFVMLANIFNVDYTCTITSEIEQMIFNNDDNKLLVEEIDDLYYKLTFRDIYSSKLTYSDIKEVFNKIQMNIIIE